MHAAIFRYGILLVLAALGVSAAIAQTDLSFAAGVDSTGQALAQSNADGYVLIESLEYPRGLWLELVDEAGQPLVGLQVEYQGRPDSLVVIRCVDPVGSVQETLVWTRPEGDSLRLVLKPKEAADLPVGLASIDWQIAPIVASLLEPEEDTHPIGWEAVAAFLRARWQDQAGRVPVQLNASTSLAVEVAHPEIVETVVAHLQQIYRPTGTPLGESAVLGIQVFRFRGGSALQEGVILYSPLFADANLEKAVREALGRPQGRLRVMDVADLTEFWAAEKFISSLVGLENCTALQSLNLRHNRITDAGPLANLTDLYELFLPYNRITDAGPLAGLTNLTGLSLAGNQIANVGPLASLTNLNHLWLSSNQITDVGPLASLAKLKTLGLDNNPIADVGPLAGLAWNLLSLRLSQTRIMDVGPLANLTNLHSLRLSSNQITDVKPLANLTNLRVLDIEDNQIEDLAPLVANTGLSEGDIVRLTGNPLSDQARNKHIPALQARGVEVHF